jgi:uncharacterized protein DUF3761
MFRAALTSIVIAVATLAPVPMAGAVPAVVTIGGVGPTIATSPPPFLTCTPNQYTNSDGVCVERPVQSPGGPPPGATAQCNDGDWSFSTHRPGTCSGHGGVLQWCPCSAASAASGSPSASMVQASVPNMRIDAVLGQSCSNWQRYIFGYDASGNVLACAGMIPDNPTWSQSVPLYGVQQIGAPCGSGSGTAQSPDGRAILCTADGWLPGP